LKIHTGYTRVMNGENAIGSVISDRSVVQARAAV